MPHVLLICTANMCRSPMAEGILASAVSGASVSSAGTHAVGDSAATEAVAVLADRGIDISHHVPRQATAELLGSEGSDLILCMERAHVRYLVTGSPGLWGRTLTLKELVRRADSVGARRSEEALPAWLARVTMGRRPADLMGSQVEDDVADPVGRGLARFRHTADELEALLARAALLARL